MATDTNAPTPRLSWLRRYGRLAFYGVRWLQRFSAAFAWVTGYIALLLLGFGDWLKQPALSIAALVFWGGLFVFLWQGLKVSIRIPLPAIDRWLERAAGVPHRPLALLEDLPFTTGDLTMRLWNHAQKKARIARNRLKLPAPPIFWSRHDPRALRILLILLLVVGVILSGTHAVPKIRAGLIPTFRAAVQIATLSPYAVTITPPAYTGRTAERITAQTQTPITLIPGSKIDSLIPNYGWVAPSLVIGGISVPFVKKDDAASLDWTAPDQLPPQDTVALWTGLWRHFSHPYMLQPDQPPTVELTGTPKPLPDGRVRIPLKAQDDYGIEKLTIHIKGMPDSRKPPALATDESEETPISIAGSNTPLETNPSIDLSASYWAGHPAELELTFSDHLGQQAHVTVPALKLPKRRFNGPAAQLIISLREELINSGADSASVVAEGLDGILSRPSLLKNDIVAVIALRSATSRLILSQKTEDLRSVVATLWNIAIRLEDGGNKLNDVLKDLQAAQQNLQNLMNKEGVTPEELRAALDRLQQAMATMLQELARKLAEQPMTPELEAMLKQMEIAPQTLDPNLLNDFMKQLEHELLSGNREKAQEMMRQLQNMMQSLADPSENTLQQMTDTMDGINEIQQLIEQQEALRDQTMEKLRHGEDVTKNQGEQESLRQVLGQIMQEIAEEIGEVPENMAAAELAMRGAARALGENNAAGALPGQQKAIDELRKGQQNLTKRLQNMMRRMVMLPLPGGQNEGQPGNDNDRSNPNRPSGDFEVQEQSREKLREILRTLRDRAGDRARPKEERDYFDRLLRQF